MANQPPPPSKPAQTPSHPAQTPPVTEHSPEHPPHPAPINLPDTPPVVELPDDTHFVAAPENADHNVILAPPGSKDYVAGQPVTEAEMNEVNKEVDERAKAAKDAAAKADTTKKTP